MKIYHQQGVQSNDSHGGVRFFWGKNNHHHVGIGYLEFDITLRKTGADVNQIDGDGNVDEPIRLVNNASSYAFSIATLATTGGVEKEQTKNVGHISTI